MEKPVAERFNLLEKYALRRSHPRRIFLDIAALTWEVYFLWNQNWQAALGIFLVMNTVGLLSTRKINYAELAQTTWGKIALLHLHPLNLLVQTTGVVFLVAGLLQQDTLTIMAGVTLIYIGHFYGWSRVHPALKRREV
ncbi:hypothetical protein EBT16_14620 [bacterium]|nr:hypothetical protein [bacterium]